MTDQVNEAVKYRKRPVVIEAVRFDGTAACAAAICCWANADDDVRGNEDPTITYSTRGDQPGKAFDMVIWTLEGDMTASPGDWIIKGVKGEFYPCKPDIFAATYELATHPSRGVVDEVLKGVERTIRWREQEVERLRNEAIQVSTTIESRGRHETALDDLYTIRAALQAAQPADQHPDDAAVDRFAAAMKEKLAAARAKGRGGWHEPDLQQRLSDMLREHVGKGDPRDVANFACFLFNRGEAIAPAAQPAASVPEGWVLVQRIDAKRVAEYVTDENTPGDSPAADISARRILALLAATPKDQPAQTDDRCSGCGRHSCNGECMHGD